MEVIQPKLCSYSYRLFGKEFYVKEFPTDEEAIEYQEEIIEKEDDEELVVC